MQKDNLFDGKFTYLDAVKIALLIVTGFSTWNVVGIMTPDGSWSWVRQIAALIVVEGAFLGFEFATADAKSRRQVRWATIGFFCSLTVISLFAGLSGLLEFGGDTLMTQHASDWLGLSWSVGDAVQASSLLTLVLWIALLASIYRIYTLNDPGKRAELESIEIGEEVSSEANKARRLANRDVAPVVAGHRAIAEIRSRYAGEMSAEQMQRLLDDVADSLKNNYSVRPDSAFVPTVSTPEPSGLQKFINGLPWMAKTVPSPVDKAVAVDPERGFVPRVPPMQKTDDLLGSLQDGTRGVLAHVGIKPRSVPSYGPSSVAHPAFDFDVTKDRIVFTPVVGIGNDNETSMVLRATPTLNNEWVITVNGDANPLYILSQKELDYVMTGMRNEETPDPAFYGKAEVKPAPRGDSPFARKEAGLPVGSVMMKTKVNWGEVHEIGEHMKTVDDDGNYIVGIVRADGMLDVVSAAEDKPSANNFRGSKYEA